jgi:hypothetical protein
MRSPDNAGFIRRGFQGAIGGIAATVTMSVALGLSDLTGVMNKQPPRMIVSKLMPQLSRDDTDVVAVVSHIGYGTSAGALYGALVKPSSRGLGSGIGFGLALWAAGYEGWLPALGVLPPAHKDKPGRAITMLLAHVVYGATLGLASRRRKH